jgi:hypothetical protein
MIYKLDTGLPAFDKDIDSISTMKVQHKCRTSEEYVSSDHMQVPTISLPARIYSSTFHHGEQTVGNMEQDAEQYV